MSDAWTIRTPRPAVPIADGSSLQARFLRLKSALHDGVTGLYSYHLHIERLNLSSDGKPIGVIVLDFPSLANLECVHGWEMSDRFLSGVAALLGALKGRTLPQSTLIALDGVHGNSFLLFLYERLDGTEMNIADLSGTVAGLSRDLAARLATAGWAPARSRIDFTAGYAFASTNPSARFERRLCQAIREARAMSLQRADRLGGSRAAEWLSILHGARLTTHYQPIVDLERGSIMGYEALTRGPAMSHFAVPEALFSCSETAPLLPELDALCRRQAVRNARGLDPKLKLFLNSLPETLAAPAFTDGAFLNTLREAALAPRNVVFEITERSAIRDFEAFGRGLAPLRRQGFLVAIDDVGTGYSSLQTISEVQPDFLKVDISLIKNIHRSLIKQEVIRSLLHVAGRIGAKVIAEGIETEEEYLALRRCNVRYGQGFFLASPAPSFTGLNGMSGSTG